MITIDTTGVPAPTTAPVHAPPKPGHGPHVGADRQRVDAPLKVTGTALYAYEHPVDEPCYVWPILSTIARGRIRDIDIDEAAAVPGVLRVLSHQSTPRLRVKTDPALWILQDGEVHYRGQIVAGVIAETPEAAREAAELVHISYDEQLAELDFDPDSPYAISVRRVAPIVIARRSEVLFTRPGEESKGDVDAGLAAAVHRVEVEYEHPSEYHCQMEPHAVIATWHDTSRIHPGATRLTLYDANQGPIAHRSLLAPLLGLLPNQLEIISPYVGGGFGGKAMPHSHLVLAALAAKTVAPRPVKLAITRQHMFAFVGHRPRSVHRVHLGAEARGRLTAIDHVSIQATSRLKRYIDQSCLATRMMYATPNRHTEHRVVELDVAPGTWMRAPGDFSGMFALESALDELADASGIDPIELRIRNEPDVDPEDGKPWSTRNLVACLRQGSERFGWSHRRPPGQRREREWLIGLGMASACFPNTHAVSLFAQITFQRGRYLVQMQAADLGTGAHTVLPQIAADALGVDVDVVDSDIGRTGTPMAMLAGGSSGTYEWGNAIVAACERFRRKHGEQPNEGATAWAQGRPPRGARKRSRHAFGAHFIEIAVSTVTGEVRVRRMLGIFAAGTIVNPRLARSQMVGGLTMAVSAALHEESFLDPRFGHIVNGDLAGYHIAAHADIPQIEIEFLEEHDPWFGAIGAKGIGEMAMVGAPAAIGNAIFNATGRRLRALPFTLDKVLTV